jgi:hypothetical protein
MKFVWVREAYTGCCTRNVRSGLAWFKTDTWKLSRMMKVSEKGRGKKDVLHIVLKCFV